MRTPIRPWDVVDANPHRLALVLPNQRLGIDTHRLRDVLDDLLAELGVVATVSIDDAVSNGPLQLLLIDPDPFAFDGRYTLVRGLRNVSRSLCPQLNVIVALDHDANATLAADGFAARLARIYGRELIYVDDVEHGPMNGPIVQSVAEVLTNIVSGPSKPLVLAAQPGIGGVLRDVAITLAGAEQSAVTVIGGGRVSCETAWAPARGSGAGEWAAFVPALIAVLAFRGQRRDAERLEAAWLRTLEDGVRCGSSTSGGLRHDHGLATFVVEVADRIGQCPRALLSSFGVTRPERLDIVR